MRCTAIGVVSLLWLTVSSAAAQDAVERGIALRQQGRDAEAVAAFAEAVDAGGGPRALAQLALAEQAVGAWVDAAVHLDQALSHTADPWIVAHRAVLEEARATIAQRVGRLDVLVQPTHAEVTVNGRSLGTGPVRDAPVLAGEVVVRVSAPGHVTIQRVEEVDAGRITRVRFQLVPEAPAEPSRVAAAAPARAPAPTPRPFDATGLHVAAVSLGGLGLLAAVGLSVSLGIRETNVIAFNACPPPMSMRCPGELATVRSAETAAGVLGAVAGTALLGAGALLLVSILLDGDGA